MTPKQLKNQAGVTLLLSVMLMAGITVITTTIGFFVIQEIRTSRSATLTEPSIIAAEGAGEQSLFRVKKGTGSTSTLSSCSSSLAYTKQDGTSATSGAGTKTIVRKCESPSVGTFKIKAGEPLVVFLYDINNINGNLCMESGTCPSASADSAGTGSQLYSSINIRYISGGFALPVNIETLDDVSLPVGGSLSVGATGTYSIPINIIGSTDERLKIILEPSAGSATVEISTVGSAPGLPDFQTVDAEGCTAIVNISDCDQSREAYKRRINITIPR